MPTKQEKIELVNRAIDRLTPPENWIQGTFARTARGTIVPPNAYNAVSWCMMGAILREIYTDDSVRHAEPIEGEIIDDWLDFYHAPIATFNDATSTTHGMVLAKFAEFRAYLNEERE